MPTVTKEELFERITKVREQYSDTEAREVTLRKLVEEAQELGFYPQHTVPGNPNTVLSMVKGYGARWNEWAAPLTCPHCETDLRSKAGPPFKREIGIVVHDSLSGAKRIRFQCPDCDKML